MTTTITDVRRKENTQRSELVASFRDEGREEESQVKVHLTELETRERPVGGRWVEKGGWVSPRLETTG
jgi:hypothetical protein